MLVVGPRQETGGSRALPRVYTLPCFHCPGPSHQPATLPCEPAACPCITNRPGNRLPGPAQQQSVCSNPRGWGSSRFAGTGGGWWGLVLTRIAHGGVQEIHGRPGQAQPVHAIWGLFEVRHHANSRVKAPRRIQGARRNAGLPPRSPSSSVGSWGSACGDRRHKGRVIRSHLGFLVLSGKEPRGGEGTQAVDCAGRSIRLYKALVQRPRLPQKANFSGSASPLFVLGMGQRLVGHR